MAFGNLTGEIQQAEQLNHHWYTLPANRQPGPLVQLQSLPLLCLASVMALSCSPARRAWATWKDLREFPGLFRISVGIWQFRQKRLEHGSQVDKDRELQSKILSFHPVVRPKCMRSQCKYNTAWISSTTNLQYPFNWNRPFVAWMMHNANGFQRSRGKLMDEFPGCTKLPSENSFFRVCSGSIACAPVVWTWFLNRRKL